jgi:hypothetical protein
VLALEDDRRDRASAELRARAARLDPTMRLETFPRHRARFDRDLWQELVSLRFVDDARGVLVLGPAGSARPRWSHPAGKRQQSALPTRRTTWY